MHSFSLFLIKYSGCDTRNAVLVVNSLGLCFYSIMIVSYSLLLGDTLHYDDDGVQAVMDNLDNAKTGLTLSVFIIGMVSTIVALYGAVNFNKALISVGGIWFLFEATRSIFVRDFYGFVIAMCFSYPHAVFFYEMKKGVMSRENYPKERVCCDCCCTC